MWQQLTGRRVRTLCRYAAAACSAWVRGRAYVEAAAAAMRATRLDGDKVYFDATS